MSHKNEQKVNCVLLRDYLYCITWIQIITDIAFYAGWPKAWAAFRLAKDVWNDSVTATTDKEKFQKEMIFPIGDPNTAYAKYFKGNSYLARISSDQIPFPNVTFEPGCRNNWHIHQRHERRRANVGWRSRKRLVSGGW